VASLAGRPLGASRVLAAALAGIVLALGLGSSADAAAPRLIMVTGGLLAEPILLSDGDEVFELYGSFFAGRAVDRAELEGPPSLRLGLFWDNALWEPYVQAGRLDELRPRRASRCVIQRPSRHRCSGRLPAVERLVGTLPHVGAVA
jgi:hypothetical protein